MWISSPSCTSNFSNAARKASLSLPSPISRLSMLRFSCAVSRCTSMWRSAAAGKMPPASSSTSFRFFSPRNSYGRAAHHAVDCDGSFQWRNTQRVAVLQPLHVPANPVQQKVVSVHFFEELFPAVMFQPPQGAARGNSSRRKKRIQRRRERADVVRSRSRHFPHHVHAHGAQLQQRNIRRNVPELRSQQALHRVLHFAEGLAGNQ